MRIAIRVSCKIIMKGLTNHSKYFHKAGKRFSAGGWPFWDIPAQGPMLQRARDLFRTEDAKDIQALVAAKIEAVRQFDVAGMDRAVAICTCGRSGSELLASYLDGHDDVIMLAKSRSMRIYEFFEFYQSLTLHDKLIAYPVFSNNELVDFFHGDFAISATDYYAAVNAVLNVFG